jgi:hypothetical protein
MDLLNILLPYLMGVLVSYLIFQPMKQWDDGYNTAKNFYGNWELGFDKGFEAAKKTFNNYDLGFGDGFEDGWNAVLEQYQRSEDEG